MELKVPVLSPVEKRQLSKVRRQLGPSSAGRTRAVKPRG
jgi:hypothetical protein